MNDRKLITPQPNIPINLPTIDPIIDSPHNKTPTPPSRYSNPDNMLDRLITSPHVFDTDTLPKRNFDLVNDVMARELEDNENLISTIEDILKKLDEGANSNEMPSIDLNYRPACKIKKVEFVQYICEKFPNHELLKKFNWNINQLISEAKEFLKTFDEHNQNIWQFILYPLEKKENAKARQFHSLFSDASSSPPIEEDVQYPNMHNSFC